MTDLVLPELLVEGTGLDPGTSGEIPDTTVLVRPAAPVTGQPLNQKSFVKRKLDITFTLQPTTEGGTPTFTESGTNQVTLRGLRASAVISQQGGFSMGELQLRVFGLTISLMNQLATLGKMPMAGRNNSVVVRAGDDINGMSLAYSGTMANAWADFQAAPDVGFQITGQAGGFGALNPVPPASYQGTASVAVIIQNIAQQLGRGFENNGVNVFLSNPYFPGTLRDQLQAAADAAGIDFIDEGDAGVIAIWPRGSARRGNVPLISPQSGMIGYPTFTANGISVRTLYNPAIQFGAMVKVESAIRPANGMWRIGNKVHELDAETPGGSWFTTFEAQNPAYAPGT